MSSYDRFDLPQPNQNLYLNSLNHVLSWKSEKHDFFEKYHLNHNQNEYSVNAVATLFRLELFDTILSDLFYLDFCVLEFFEISREFIKNLQRFFWNLKSLIHTQIKNIF